MSRIEPPRPNLLDNLQAQQQQRLVFRLLGGNPGNLQVGQRLNATVLETTSAGTLVNLRGARILLEGLPDFVRPGSDVMLRVAGMFPEPLLEMETGNRSPGSLVTGDRAPAQLQTRDAGARLASLDIGQELLAKVAQPLTGDRVVIDLKGALVEATLRGALPEAAARGELRQGAQLSVRVEQLQPEVVLRLLTASSGPPPEPAQVLRALQILRANLADNVPVGQSLESLQQALARLQESPPGSPGKLPTDLPASPGKLATDSPGRLATDSPASLGKLAADLPAGLAKLAADLPASLATDSPASLAKLATDSPAGPGKLPTDSPASLGKLQTLIQSLLARAEPPTPEQLAAFVNDGGLHFEAKLAQAAQANPEAFPRIADKDLKGLLLQTLDDIEAKQVVKEVLAGPVLHQLDHIETQQAVNLLALFRGEPYLLQLPFPNGQRLGTVFLAIEADGGQGRPQGGGQRGHNVLFQLDLEQLGTTRIDAHFTPKTVRVIFFMERSPALAQLRAALPGFRQTLLELGYEEVLLAAKPLAQMSPVKQQRFTALAAGMHAQVGLLDVKA